MPPKKQIKRAQINETTDLLEKQLDSALKQRLATKTSLKVSQNNLPSLRATTDHRLDAFVGRAVDFDIDSIVTLNHPPLALTDQIVFKFRTETDLLLGKSSLRC